ncbi:hypothetical protein QJQ45_016991 [Haematococcus lacustris]|nr:hypothetical protein QJQ45_030440 [Haematococcus lacustris]KAJ9515009.1 hypothetical protein QJQ45_016991 [Haematococcus lacustris]
MCCLSRFGAKAQWHLPSARSSNHNGNKRRNQEEQPRGAARSGSQEQQLGAAARSGSQEAWARQVVG